MYSLSMVLVLPPAPAARVLLGLAFAIFSFWSAAALRRMAVLAPPGGVGEEGRAVLAPDDAAGALTGESDLGEAIIMKRGIWEMSQKVKREKRQCQW